MRSYLTGAFIPLDNMTEIIYPVEYNLVIQRYESDKILNINYLTGWIHVPKTEFRTDEGAWKGFEEVDEEEF